MKNKIKILITLLLLTAVSPKLFASQLQDSSSQVTQEQSNLLLDPRAQKIIKEKQKELKKQNLILLISQVSTLNINYNSEAFVYIALDYKDKYGQIHSFGSVVGNTNSEINDSDEPFKIKSVFFKPAETVPGGATVGN